LKSPVVTERGKAPTAKLLAGAKPPLPLPKSTETLLLEVFAVAKSSIPSPLKSPVGYGTRKSTHCKIAG
jgi:hypothetical protein